jgi:hypothetical protein
LLRFPRRHRPAVRRAAGCFGALDQLAKAVLKNRGPDLIAPPLPSPPSATPSETFVVTTTPSDAIAFGAPLTIAWKRGAAFQLTEIDRVTFAVEVRRNGANDTALQTFTATTEQLDVRVAAADTQLVLAALRPFALGLTAGQARVRLIVIAANSDALFGRSEWLDVRAPIAAAATAAATRVHTAWSACSVECGSGGTQTRRADCLSGDGTRSLASSQCATGASPSRPCVSLLPKCAFVRYSVIWPRPETVALNVSEFSSNFEFAALGVEFNGGEAGRNTTISLCDSRTFNPCTTTKPVGCELLTTLPVSTSGSTRTIVEFTMGNRDQIFRTLPRSFSLLFSNDGGSADQWRLTPPYTVRVPDLRYAMDGELSRLSGPVSVASVHGVATLSPANRYISERMPDIGMPVRVSLNLTDSFFMMKLRIDYPIVAFAPVFEFSDFRAVKSPGLVVAVCFPMFRNCKICDANDTRCDDTKPQYRWFYEKLPDVCAARVGDDIWATAPPDQPIVLPDPTGLAQATNSVGSSFFDSSANDGSAMSALLSLLLLATVAHE